MENKRIYMISIIVPVYNAEKGISRCLDSIINQTYKSLEIILIDDGSTDKSADICDSYAQNDKRVKVIHQENAGVSAARNVGLEKATGEYIMFVDADDWIESAFCETILRCAKKYNAKLVKSLAVNRDEKGTVIKDKFEIANTVIVNIDKDFSFLKQYATGVVWGTLYKSELVKELRFATDLYVGEDTLFFAQTVRKCDEIVILKEKMYNYVFYTESASHGKIDAKKMSNLIAWKRIISCFSTNDRISKSAKGAYARQCVDFLQNMCETGRKDQKFWEVCKKGLNTYILDALLTDSLLMKIKYVCAYISPDMLCVLRKIAKR